jgi:hypothetical protein
MCSAGLSQDVLGEEDPRVEPFPHRSPESGYLPQRQVRARWQGPEWLCGVPVVHRRNTRPRLGGETNLWQDQVYELRGNLMDVTFVTF